MSGVGDRHRAIRVEAGAAAGDETAAGVSYEAPIQSRQNLRWGRRLDVAQNSYANRHQHRGLEALAADVAYQHHARAVRALQDLVEVPADLRGREVDGLDAVQVPCRGQRGQQERLHLRRRCQFAAQALALAQQPGGALVHHNGHRKSEQQRGDRARQQPLDGDYPGWPKECGPVGGKVHREVRQDQDADEGHAIRFARSSPPDLVVNENKITVSQHGGRKQNIGGEASPSRAKGGHPGKKRQITCRGKPHGWRDPAKE